MSIQKKLVVVGDSACGKTSLLIAYTQKQFFTDYVPTVFENYTTDIEVGGRNIQLTLCDTAGNEGYDRLRPLLYTGSNVILMCFSVVWKASFENISNRWSPEIDNFCPNVPIFLIGTKEDLRHDPIELEKLAKFNTKPISKEAGEQMAKRIGAVCYMECSAKTLFQVNEVFAKAAKATIAGRKKEKKKSKNCVLI